MRTSWRLLKQVRRALLVAFAFSGCINLLLLATPIYALQIFENVVPLASLESLLVLTAIAASAILACSLLEMARDTVLLRAAYWLDHELGHHILENGLKLATPPATLGQDQRALAQFKSFISTGAAATLLDALWTPIFLLALAVLHPLVGAVALASSLLLLAVSVLHGLATARIGQDHTASGERAERWSAAVAGTGQLAGALGLARGAAEQWERFNRWQVATGYALDKRTAVVKALGRTVRIGSQIALYGIGAWLVVRSELVPGALVASAILLARAQAPIEHIIASMRTARAARDAYGRLRKLPADANVPHVRCGDAGPRGSLCVTGASFSYPQRTTPAVRSVSLRLSPGECLGVTGPGGSGKTTLAALMAGALTPSSGSVDLDGIPIVKWQRGDCEPPLGYLPDEPVLLDGTVHENIARFTETSQISVARAAIRAGVHDTLQSLPQGYDTPVGQHGSGLSLRERRAVSFARAVFGSPRMIVLDEPDNGLDAAGIRQLGKVLQALKQDGVGLVLATQDQRLLALADQVLILDAGAVQSSNAATGTDLPRRIDAVLRPIAVPHLVGLH